MQQVLAQPKAMSKKQNIPNQQQEKQVLTQPKKPKQQKIPNQQQGLSNQHKEFQQQKKFLPKQQQGLSNNPQHKVFQYQKKFLPNQHKEFKQKKMFFSTKQKIPNQQQGLSNQHKEFKQHKKFLPKQQKEFHSNQPQQKKFLQKLTCDFAQYLFKTVPFTPQYFQSQSTDSLMCLSQTMKFVVQSSGTTEDKKKTMQEISKGAKEWMKYKLKNKQLQIKKGKKTDATQPQALFCLFMSSLVAGFIGYKANNFQENWFSIVIEACLAVSLIILIAMVCYNYRQKCCKKARQEKNQKLIEDFQDFQEVRQRFFKQHIKRQ